MSAKKVLVVILLAISFCFVSGVGYGKIEEWMDEVEVSLMDLRLLEASVKYIMTYPTNFINVAFYYDRTGAFSDQLVYLFPKLIDTKGKIYVMISDNRGQFSYKSGIVLLDSFKKELEIIWSFVKVIARNMDVDIVATLKSRQGIPLAYFYQGEYHLWEE